MKYTMFMSPYLSSVETNCWWDDMVWGSLGSKRMGKICDMCDENLIYFHFLLAFEIIKECLRSIRYRKYIDNCHTWWGLLNTGVWWGSDVVLHDVCAIIKTLYDIICVYNTLPVMILLFRKIHACIISNLRTCDTINKWDSFVTTVKHLNIRWPKSRNLNVSRLVLQ